MGEYEIINILQNIMKNYNKMQNLDFDNIDLNSTQVLILLEVIKVPGIFQEELRKCLLVEKPAITKALKKLIDEGYVVKQKKGEDKRFSYLFPTEKGISLEPYLKTIEKYHINVLFNNLKEDEIYLLKDCLDKINENIVTEISLR